MDRRLMESLRRAVDEAAALAEARRRSAEPCGAGPNEAGTSPDGRDNTDKMRQQDETGATGQVVECTPRRLVIGFAHAIR